MCRLIRKWVTPPLLWLRNGLEQFRIESAYLGNAIADLIVNLHCLSAKRSVGATTGTVIVAVHHVGFQWYLTFLREIGIIRNTRIVVIRTGAEMSRFLAGLRSHNQPAKLVLGRNLYFRYHDLIAADEYSRGATII
jgi:hypothetical protein